MPLKTQQYIQQRIRVFAPRKANHDPIAIVDHIEIGERLTHKTAEFFVCFVFFVRALFVRGIGRHTKSCIVSRGTGQFTTRI